MKSRLITFALLSGVSIFVSACSHTDGSTYKAGSLGRVGPADKGVVVNVRLVNVEGTTQTGTLLGGIVGSAVVYDAAGGNNDALKILGAAGGAMVGGLVGGGTEKAMTGTTAYEYIVEMDSGHMETIVQRDDQPIAHGDRVILLKGPDAKIILDTTT